MAGDAAIQIGNLTTDTHCPYCAFQCGMTLVPDDASGETRLTVTARDYPTNKGGLCRKGWTAAAAGTKAFGLDRDMPFPLPATSSHPLYLWRAEPWPNAIHSG